MMSKFWKGLGSAFATIVLLVGPLTSNDQAEAAGGSATAAGFTVSWGTLYEPNGCSKFLFNYTNGAPRKLLQVGFELTSIYGDSIARESLIGAPPGGSGTWSEQICAFDLDGLGPYRMRVYAEDYPSFGGSTVDQTVNLFFTSRDGGSSSTPDSGATVPPGAGNPPSDSDVSEPVAQEPERKLNAGSFKGYVALYAKGYEGKRFTAKVGKDWVVRESLESDFVRIVEFTGAGYTINVRMYIDRVLEKTITVTTK